MTTVQESRSISQHLFDQARIELEAGDLIQASEKLWGAAAHSLKSIAETRGWKHKSYAHFYRIIRNLSEESGNKDIIYLLNTADSLHSNFYENWMQEDEIMHYAGQVSQLIDRLSEVEVD